MQTVFRRALAGFAALMMLTPAAMAGPAEHAEASQLPQMVFLTPQPEATAAEFSLSGTEAPEETALPGASPAPVPSPEAVPSRTPEADMVTPLAASASPDATAMLFPRPEEREVTDGEISDDGILRVLLRSLNRPQTLHLTVEGVYALEGDAGFCFVDGAQPVLTLEDGKIWMETGGMIVCLGTSVTFTRHASETVSGLRIDESEKDGLYCGDLTVSAEGDALRCVLNIHIEDYLLGVVAYEMSDSFPVEALKAQAVAARTYAMRKKFASGARDYDVSDTTADQVFKGFDPSYENVIAAVEATRGVVGTVDGGFAECFYTASNGGVIALPSDVWGIADDGVVQMRIDPYDLENPRSMVSSLTFSADLSDCAALKKMLASKLPDGLEPVRVNAVGALDEKIAGSGMYRTLRFELTARREAEVQPTPVPEVQGEKSWWNDFWGTEPTPAPTPETVYVEEEAAAELSVYEDVKDGLGLGINGSDYELVSIVPGEESFTLELRRFGHGAGMSQRGAQWMAGQYGCTWTQILGFYYPGMTLERMQIPEAELTQMDPVRGYPRPEPSPTPAPKPLPALEDGEWYAAVTLADRSSMLNVRERPTTASRILDQFSPDRKVIACGEPDAEGWIAIRTAEISGYCKIDYLTPSETTTPSE